MIEIVGIVCNLPSTDILRRIRMGFFLKDACFSFRGDVLTLSSHANPLCTYSTNAFGQFVTFQNFHREIKPKGFVCNPCDAYLSFEEEVLLKNK
ncbi:MAG: hypothetical protein ACYSUB_21265 [Planctomycetota bacterium]